MTRDGGCACGALRFRAEGAPINIRLCHCRNCQQAMQAPYFARALYDQKAVTITGAMGRHPSSDRLERCFCPDCGSTVFAIRKDGSIMGIALAAFDRRDDLVPTQNIWVSEKLDWVQLDPAMEVFDKGAPN